MRFSFGRCCVTVSCSTCRPTAHLSPVVCRYAVDQSRRRPIVIYDENDSRVSIDCPVESMLDVDQTVYSVPPFLYFFLFGPGRMRHFYKNVLSGLVFWLLLSQTMSLFNSSTAASVADEESEEELESDQVEGSEGHHFGDILHIVKREILAGETGRSSSGIFNTTLAFTIPLFSFTLPDRATAGKDYTKQAALSLFGLALVGGITVIPYVWAASKGSVGKKSRVE